MNERNELFIYRQEQANTTLAEAQKMLNSDFTARSIINRAYYAMFYMVLALFLKKEILVTTSKHSGILSVFDKEFVHTGFIDRAHSKALHRVFDRRLEFDYKELIVPAIDEARIAVLDAQNFIVALQEIC